MMNGAKIQELIEQLSDPMALVRSSAAKGLSGLAEDQDITAALPSLIKALEDKDISVRRRSADALGAAAFYKQDITSAISALIKVLEDEDTMALKNAARALSDAAEKGQNINLALSPLMKLTKTSFGKKEDDFTKLAKEYAAKAIDFAAKNKS